MGTFRVREPKVPEGCPEVTVKECSNKLTLRAEEVEEVEEVDTLKNIHQCQPH